MQPMQVNVTAGAVERIRNTGGQDDFKPILQVISIKQMTAAAGQGARYRVILSDGRHHQQSMLTTAQNELVTSGQMVEGCLISLDEFILNDIGAKKIIIILKASVMCGAVPKIGDPVAFDGTGNGMPMGGGNAAADPIGVAPAPALAGGYGSGQNAGYGGGAQQHQPKQEPVRGGYNAGGYNTGGGGGGNPYGGGGGGAAAYGANRGGGGGYGGGAGPVQRLPADVAFTPIADLNPYRNCWKLRARVTSKSDVRRYANQRGEGYLMSVDLLDEHGGEIRGTFFKDAVDKFNPILEVNSVYSFTGGRVKVANKQFSNLQCDYEITFHSDSEILPLDDDKRIKAMNLNFKRIMDLSAVEVNATTDIMAVVKDFQDMATITTKAGREVEKRNITLVDDSGAEVVLTMWGAHAKVADERLRGAPVVALKGVKVSDYNGVSLSTFNSSSVAYDPDLPEARELAAWWARTGSTQGGFTAMTTAGSGGGSGGGPRGDHYDVAARIGVAGIKEEQLGHKEKPDYVSLKAYVSFVKHDQESGPWYTACPIDGCNKKVVEEMDQGWRCEKCQRSHQVCKRRYILSLSMSDHTGKDYFSAFNDVAQPMLGGHSADELFEWKTSGQEDLFEDTFAEACWKQVVMRVRVKVEMVNDEQRTKSTIVAAEPVDPVKESAALIRAIKEYN